jgi:hypothetical protein
MNVCELRPMINAIAVVYRTDPCGHSHLAYSGSIPCTGDVRCAVCNGRWATMEEAKAQAALMRRILAW